MPNTNDILRHVERFSTQSWSTLWKTALVRLPRAVPMSALKITCPGGPQPFYLCIPSRDKKRTIPLFVFVPPAKNPETAKFPVVVDFHGGGFYLGSCLEQAPFCAKLARELNAVVLGVDYRMAPLDKFPAALEDAEDIVSAIFDSNAPGYLELRHSIVKYMCSEMYSAGAASPAGDSTTHSSKDKHSSSHSHRHHRQINTEPALPADPSAVLDSSRVAFSGASSGGNIALNLGLSVPKSQECPEGWPSRIPVSHSRQIPLLLLYPAVDLRQLPSERFRHEHMPPKKEKSKMPDIDDHLAATYVSREMAGHPRASPGLVDVSTGLDKNAKILLILSGLDTLWQQSEAWCQKVEAEGRGKDMKVMRYADRKHGWTQMPETWLTAEEKTTRLEVLDECVRFTEVAWAGGDPVKTLQREVGDVVVPHSEKEPTE